MKKFVRVSSALVGPMFFLHLFLMPALKAQTTIVPRILTGVQGKSTVTPLGVRFDYNIFRKDSTEAYLEFAYSVPDSTLHFFKHDTTESAQLLLHARILKGDSVVVNQTWKSEIVSEWRSIGRFVELIRIAIPSAQYHCSLWFREGRDSTDRDSVSFDLSIPKFSMTQPDVSDLELCNNIIEPPDSSVSRFNKNSLIVVPEPSSLFLTPLGNLFYYAELYNLDQLNGPEAIVTLSILDSRGSVVGKTERRHKKTSRSLVEVGTFNIQKIPTGKYTLQLTLGDSITPATVVRERRFNLYNPTMAAQVKDSSNRNISDEILLSPFGIFSEAELDQEILYIKYILRKENLRLYQSISGVNSKREFLYHFWRNTDPGSTPTNFPFRTEYFKRIAFANNYYSVGDKPGWLSDRGRVYIVYGPPDDQERYANQVDSKPYEVWSYNSIQGGVQFYFVDKNGFSDYVLVHSTHSDEIHDEDWRRYLNGF